MSRRKNKQDTQPLSSASAVTRRQGEQISSQTNKEAQVGSASFSLHQEARYFSGPLPSPELLADYEALVPGCAELIITQFVKQGEHRMDLERKVIESDIRRSNWGLGAGFALALVTLTGAFYITLQGYPVQGISAIVVAIGSLTAVFVYGTLTRKRERQRKAELLEG